MLKILKNIFKKKPKNNELKINLNNRRCTLTKTVLLSENLSLAVELLTYINNVDKTSEIIEKAIIDKLIVKDQYINEWISGSGDKDRYLKLINEYIYLSDSLNSWLALNTIKDNVNRSINYRKLQPYIINIEKGKKVLIETIKE